MNASFPFLPKPKTSIITGSALRILPVGASINWGWGSAEGNGYRAQLKKRLIANGNSVHFVGTQYSGSMSNGANEGYPGYRVDQVASIINPALGYYPNVVLFHLGTNDCAQNFDVANAHNRLGQMIDNIFGAITNVTIIVTTLLPNGNPNTMANVRIYNANLASMVAARPGQKLMLYDMFSQFSLSDIADGTHPTDTGYLKMGDSFHSALDSVASWITPPRVTNIPDVDFIPGPNNQCSKSPRIEFGPIPIQTDSAAGASDGDFYCDMTGSGSDDYIWMDTQGKIYLYENIHSPPNWNFRGIIATGVGAARPNIHLADLDNDRRCDYLVVDPVTGAVGMWKNHGRVGDSFLWENKGNVFRGGACPAPSKIIFADLNGDGKADIACVGSNGEVHGWLNTGPVAGTWNPIGLIVSGVGNGQTDIRFADIDGNGRADLLWVDRNTGWVTTWTNAGAPTTINWTYRGLTSYSFGYGGVPGATIKFANLGGLGRADYIYADPATNRAWVWYNKCPAPPPPPAQPIRKMCNNGRGVC